MPDSIAPKSWAEWYQFAYAELGLGHDECVEYANLRFVEEQNRASLRGRSEGDPSTLRRLPRTRPA